MKSLEQLLAQWEAGTLAVDEMAELKRRLTSPEERAELVDVWLLDEAIYDTLRVDPCESQAQVRSSVEETRKAPTKHRVLPRRRYRWFAWHEVRVSLRWPLGLAFATCLLLLGVNAYYQNSKVGSLTMVRGEVVVNRDGKRLGAVQGQFLYPGDRVIVRSGGSAMMTWDEEPTRLQIAADTEFQLKNPIRGKRILLQKGILQATVAPQVLWHPMILATPQAEAKVVGTQFSLSATGTVTRLAVLEGAVLFRKTRFAVGDNQNAVMVHSGQVAEAAPGKKLETEFLTGFLSSDVWTVLPGTPLRNAAVQGTLVRPSPETASSGKSGFVERLRGYLLPPATGDFTMWIAPFNAGAAAELWVSSDENPDHKRLIAFSRPAGGTTPAPAPSSEPNPARNKAFGAALSADWGRSPNQKSSPQSLIKGRRYYFEVWHEGSDVSSLALGWKVPGQPLNTPPAMVDLQNVSPYFESTATDARNTPH